ncbi:hypothetical protein EXT67_20635 [Pectobacterium atrosepticum]|uniref:Uncharacterized protein n=2 Tax=Caudoviricetes TaxID=2731619 RepID=A0A2U7NMB1_9CAUD|nr:hypothetical protein [Pectobacterium atrosepticum]YP_007392530.1 hypothetical protein phiTE_068 [Pectobacterium phage phiTE]YP_009625521.1 hypothetical protein FDJ56_gp09 [Pectobacterium phage vB_PatP_CB5]AEZ66234.1 hypothetical protein phiTE_068 [Pectobacterium phage phiTE]ARW58982.1 hypothetical protein CB5_09 [Pectobacterium phage vB_PatP_CB5]MCL6318713.1 hypothetical protein [Pectobacterium atrosepticum]
MKGSVRITEEVFQKISALRPIGMTWNQYLAQINSFAEAQIIKDIAEDYNRKRRSQDFLEHCKKCAETVATWPEWKQRACDPMTALSPPTLKR